MYYSLRLFFLASLLLLMMSGLAAAFQCASPTPTPTPAPTPNLTAHNNEIVTVINPSVVSGAPGTTVTFRGSITNTTSETYTFGYGSFATNFGGCVGNISACPILNVGNLLSTNPIPPNGSTGEVDLIAFELNPNYLGPLPTIIDFTFYTFRPGMFSGIATFSLRIQPNTNPSLPPLLFTDPCTQHTVTLDSVYLTTEPFGLMNSDVLNPDGRTRLALFAWNMNLQPGEGAAAVTVEAIDSQQATHVLPVEFMSDVAGQDGLTQIVVRLPDDLPQGTDTRLRVRIHGLTSNEAPLSIKPA